MKKYIYLFTLSIIISSCGPIKTPMTENVKKNGVVDGYPYYNNSGIKNTVNNVHRGIYNLQIYTSSTIILTNKLHGTLIIPANSKGIVEKESMNGDIAVRFEMGDEKYLWFRSKDRTARSRKYFMADWSASGGPEVMYGNIKYKVDMMRGSSRSTYILVGVERNKKVSTNNGNPKMDRPIIELNRAQKEFALSQGNNHSRTKKTTEKQGKFTAALPPILSVTDITLSKSILNAEEEAKLSITIKNTGPGKAKNVYAKLTGGLNGLDFPSKSYFPTISEKGGTQTIYIDIKGGLSLPTAQALIQIDIVEPNFKLSIPGKQLKFQTKEFRKPNLILAQYAIVESQSANPNKQIDLNEIIDLKFSVQNIGQGNSDLVKVNVVNNQKGVMSLGVVQSNNEVLHKEPSFNKIAPGKYKTITYRYIANSEFTDNELEFTISSRERLGKYGFSERKSFPINKRLEETGYIRTIASNNTANPGNVIIADIPDIVSEVDINIPSTNEKQTHTYALIIGNEDYSTYQTDLSSEVNVDFAINDAQIYKSYCEKTLGIPSKQIKLLTNATYGQMSQGIEWIKNLADVENGSAKLIFYYSGHGLPDEQTKQGYLIPVDVSGNNVKNGIALKKVYDALSEFPSERATVFLDACFSGGARNESLVAMKGLKIRPKEEDVSGNTVVFASSSGNESSAVYREKQHGYFTYYLLKKLQESKGEVDYKTLDSYLNYQVKKATGLNGKVQNPQCTPSSEIDGQWENWKLK